MHPVLLRLGSVTIYSYGVLVAAGVLLGLWYARRLAPSMGLDSDRVWSLGIYAVLAGLVGAKIWLILIAASYYWSHPSEMFSMGLLQSGGTFYGGLAGALIVLVLYARFNRMAFLSVADAFAVAMPLGHAVGRLGCFAAGCCWGKQTWLPWGVTFKDVRAALIVGTPLGVPLHPTQLYEAAALAVDFGVLAWMATARKFKGQLVAAYFVLYGLERGLIEFLRGDPDRTPLFHGAVTLMQLVSVAMIGLGVWLWVRGRRQLAPVTVPERAGTAESQ